MENIDVFKNKSFAELLKDIHDNALEKRSTINSTVTLLIGMIKSQEDAIVLAPIVREFIDVGVKNDDQVIKVATIVQRMVSAQSYANSGDTGMLSELEKEQLLRNALTEQNEIHNELSDLTETVEKTRAEQNS